MNRFSATLFLTFMGASVSLAAPAADRVAPPPFAAMGELPITSIRPEGWLRQYLVNQRNGLTGHLENGGYPFDRLVWAGAEVPDTGHDYDSWWPYEQNAYWIDGMIRCGRLLDDPLLIDKAHLSIDYVLNHPAPNGYLGPIQTPTTGEMNRWIHAVFFRALMAEYSATGDPRIPSALRAYFLAGDTDFFLFRDSNNIEGMLWTFARTGDKALLDLAEQAYAGSEQLARDWEVAAPRLMWDRPAHDHGVSYNERMKLGAMLYAFTGKMEYLRPSVAAHAKLTKYHLLASGVNVSSELIDPLSTTESAETCDVSDFTWSTGYLLMATGDASYGDAIERAMFNAAPGCTAADFKSLQYFSAPNQVVCTHDSFQRTGQAETAFAPNAHTACCPGNVNRAMPDYVARMWMQGSDGSLVAALLGPSRVSFVNPADGVKVEITEATGYPFSGDIRFEFKCSSPTRLPFALRIPRWSGKPVIRINGSDPGLTATPGSFLPINREISDGDVIEVTFPQHIAVESGPNDTSVIVRGPLVYSLRIEENWTVDPDDEHSTPEFPAFDVTAASPWNYALAIDGGDVAQLAEVVKRELTDAPWTLDTTPLEIRLPARQVLNWGLIHTDKLMPLYWDLTPDPKTGRLKDWTSLEGPQASQKYTFTPPVPAKNIVAAHLGDRVQTVTLIPLGAAKLRITYFPTCRKPDAE